MYFFLIILFVFHSLCSKGSEASHYYRFSDDCIDVVIPSVEKDLLTLDLCIKGIQANGANINRIIVVSKNKLTNLAEWFPEEQFPFSLADIARVLAQGDPFLEEKLLLDKSRAGWYYQQLLKLYASFVIPNLSSNVLILDSDTIFLHPVSFVSHEKAGLYNPGEEYNPPYFTHAKKLLLDFRKIFANYSGISHHMLFQRPVLEDLFTEVESLQKRPFWHAFCDLVDSNDLFESGASEYEIYFNYVFGRTDQVSIRKFKWKNICSLKEIELYKQRGFDYVSIHEFSRID